MSERLERELGALFAADAARAPRPDRLNVPLVEAVAAADRRHRRWVLAALAAGVAAVLLFGVPMFGGSPQPDRAGGPDPSVAALRGAVPSGSSPSGSTGGPAMRAVAATRHPAGPTRTGLAGLHILIVDNDPVALAALRGLLEGWGCTVDAAADGAAAEALLRAHAAALWLFDYHLDDGDTGIALCARLRERFGARPTLILSADDSGEVRRAALEHGLSLLQKPVRPLALKSVLDRMLASRL